MQAIFKYFRVNISIKIENYDRSERKFGQNKQITITIVREVTRSRFCVHYHKLLSVILHPISSQHTADLTTRQ